MEATQVFRQQMFLPTQKQSYPTKDHTKEKELLGNQAK